MKSTGILIDKFRHNDLVTTLTLELNKCEKDIVVFYSDFGVCPVLPKFSFMHQKEAFAVKTSLIATSINTAQILLKTDAVKKYFYIWNFEWMQEGLKFNELANIYLNPDVTLIVRSLAHKEVVENVWKEPLVMKDFYGIHQL